MEYLYHIGIIFGIYGILALSLNLLVGYTGLLSVAHAGFYGIGAYVTALLMTNLGYSFIAAVIFGVLITMVVAFFIGLVLSRFKDDIYVLASLGFNVIVFNILLNWQSVTRGPLGIPGIPRPEIFGIAFKDNLLFLILVGIFLTLIYYFSSFIVNSSFGRALKAIREDEGALQVFGYRTHYFKLIVFVITAGLASIAGSFFATYITFIDPSSFVLAESILILSMIILGGLASLEGSILGVLILILLPEVLRFVGFPSSIAAQMRQVIYGLILVILMIYKPEGIKGEYKL